MFTLVVGPVLIGLHSMCLTACAMPLNMRENKQHARQLFPLPHSVPLTRDTDVLGPWRALHMLQNAGSEVGDAAAVLRR
jgi:hypothetical protein